MTLKRTIKAAGFYTLAAGAFLLARFLQTAPPRPGEEVWFTPSDRPEQTGVYLREENGWAELKVDNGWGVTRWWVPLDEIRKAR